MISVYLIIAAYLVLTLLVGFVGQQKTEKTPEDYFLASRGIGAIVMFFTFIASNFSAFFFLGFAGEGYRIGYSYYPIMAFGTAFAAVAFYFIGYRTWTLGQQYKYITPPEMIGDLTQNKTLKLIFLLVMVFFTLPYIAIQPLGAGYIVNTLTDGQISQFAGALVLTIFIIIYVFIGGMRTVAVTDLIQGVLMFTLMFLAVWVIAEDFGGLAQANLKVLEQNPELFSRNGPGSHYTPQKWFSLMILWLFCVPMFPHLFMRFFISKDQQALKTSTFFYALVPSFLFILPITIGVIGHLSFPDLAATASDNIIPKMLLKHTPLWFAALVLVGAIAAFMSSLDSMLLALSTMLTRDVYVSYFNHNASLEKQVFLGRIFVAICAIVGLVIAITSQKTIFSIVKFAFTGYAVLFPTTVAVLYVKNVSAKACVLSIIVGEFLVVALFFNWIPAHWVFHFESIVPVILVSSFIIAVGTVLKKR